MTPSIGGTVHTGEALKGDRALTHTGAVNHLRDSQAAAHTWADTAPVGQLDYLWNDAGNADRLICAHGEDLIYCEEHKGFMVWTGTHWAHDDFVYAERMAEEVLRHAFAEAGSIQSENRRKEFLRFLNQSLQRTGISNMVHSAKRKAVRSSIRDFDVDPLLLNCRNGTLDLTTGELREHRREDRISKMIPMDYDPRADCPTFGCFLNRIMGNSPDAAEGELERAERLVQYLQRAFGCAATGRPEKVLFVLHGSGNNGKTTLLETIRETLGNQEYGGEIQIETLMARAREAAGSNAINADLADLRGCRFVSSSEVEQGHRLSLARVKYITGLGQIRARYLHERFFNFRPTHKLFLDCNHRPVITDPNDAVWNRVKCIPFEVSIPPEEIDTDLPRRLRAELPGILRWIVEGASLYLRQGLVDIPEVLVATEQYRHESDRLAEFLEDRCTFAPKAWVPVTALWQAYESWANSVGERYPLTKASFEERLMRLECKKARDPSGSVRAWKGIRLSAATDNLTAPDANSMEDETRVVL